MHIPFRAGRQVDTLSCSLCILSPVVASQTLHSSRNGQCWIIKFCLTRQRLLPSEVTQEIRWKQTEVEAPCMGNHWALQTNYKHATWLRRCKAEETAPHQFVIVLVKKPVGFNFKRSRHTQRKVSCLYLTQLSRLVPEAPVMNWQVFVLGKPWNFALR